MHAAAKTSAVASRSIPLDTADYFKDAAKALLHKDEHNIDPVTVVARCLAAMSRRSSEVISRSLITGEVGLATVQVSTSGRRITPSDVMFMVGELSRQSRRGNGQASLSFESEVGKIQCNSENGVAFFDLAVRIITC